MNKIPNLFLIGPMGSGKSTVGRYLSRELQMDFYDSDKEIEKRTGVSISWIFDVEGETGFRIREQKVIDELTKMQGIILATGGGAILMTENRHALAARGIVFYLRVSLDEQIHRTERNQNRPLLENKSDLKKTLADLNQVREKYYLEIADFVIDTDHLSAQAVAKEIIANVQVSRYGNVDTYF